MRALILGLGNAMRGDDAIGLRVADVVRDHLPGGVEVDVDTGGGLNVMERLVGYDRALIVDAVMSGGTPGTVVRLDAEKFPTQHTASSHDVTLATALAMARSVGLSVPAHVGVVAVEVEPALVFGVRLSPEVEAAVPAAARAVEEECRRLLKEDS